MWVNMPNAYFDESSKKIVKHFRCLVVYSLLGQVG